VGADVKNILAILTTVLEVLGLMLIVAGVWIAFGVAAALMVAGVMALGVSFLLTRGGST
jgi:hypothetical protein